MVFASILFLLFFLPIVVIGYFSVPLAWRNRWLIASSVLFYLWGGGLRDTLLLLAVATVDFFMAKKIWRSSRPRFWLVIAVVWNLTLLSIFKYANFLIETTAEVASWFPAFSGAASFEHSWLRISLPLGISFFIFETLSYLIDVYRKQQVPAKKLSDYAMYITLFPHLVAGPVYRFRDIYADLDPVGRAAKITSISVHHGWFLFAIGLAKKTLVANPLARVADLAFARPALSGLESWVGILSYTFQIYFDFSGYSLMAIGLAKIFGFSFPINFNAPYTAVSITDFWHRWHMTLSHWFRDYLYIPLGGNRLGAWRTYRNLFFVFLLCGLWHGASWTFVIWGAYHGIFLCLERWGLVVGKVAHPWIARGVTFLIVVCGWVFFRANSLKQAVDYLGSMFGQSRIASDPKFLLSVAENNRFWLAFLVASLSLLSVPRIWRTLETEGTHVKAKTAITWFLVLACACELAAGTFNPFIYFRF